jgi:UDP-N-acetylglucosamine 2-epimerase (non-hydrolysing)
MKDRKIKVMTIFGTRPEAIKFASLIEQLKRSESDFRVTVCVTAQHMGMLDQALKFFEISPDFDLKIMKPNQSLFSLTADSLRGIETVLKNDRPDLVFVQGDTTTALVGALAGFYCGVNVAHLEAGLRSGTKLSPFPEEINRKLVGQIANYHFAPTIRALLNLNREGINDNVWVVGNTVIDSLFLCLDIIRNSDEQVYYESFKKIDFSKKIILVTGHRRESFGTPFENICGALMEIASIFRDIEIVYPVHLNPKVKEVVHKMLSGIKNIHLMEPLEYNFFVWLMDNSYLVLTDSGGIQEEAPSLGKPVLVMREVTERIEGIESGTAKLVGTDRNKIVDSVSLLLNDSSEYNKMSKAINPYGDGKASKRIVEILNQMTFLEKEIGEK